MHVEGCLPHTFDELPHKIHFFELCVGDESPQKQSGTPYRAKSRALPLMLHTCCVLLFIDS
jgi:hypothetical protein